MWLYKVLVVIFTAFSKIMGVRFSGRENVPPTGPLVVIANHRHWSDIVLMALAVYPRQVHFMSKSEYASNRLFKFLIKYLGSFTVERGEADMHAIKTALGYLKQGEVLGIYPEGTRNRTASQLLAFKPGAFVLADRGRAQVLPVAITAAERYAKLGRPNTRVQVGPPFGMQDFLNERGKADAPVAADFAQQIIEKMLQNQQDFKD